MYNVSENFNEDIHRFDRKINIKLSVNGEAIEKENLLKATIERAVTDGTSFTLGQTFSSKVVIELYKCDIEFKQGDRVDLSLLLEADKYQIEEPEEVPQGVYYIDKVEVNGVKVKLTAFDLFYTMEEEYSSTIEYPTTTKKLMAEITSKCGFKHDSTLEDITIVEKLEGYTAKELIGFIAGIQGKNAIINHKGEISFVDFTKVNYQLDPSSYITFTKENNYKITGVTCLFGDVGINSGDLTGNVLAFKNPWCKQSDVDRILKKYKGLTLTNANVRYIGNFGLLPSDIITLQDKEGAIHNLFISKHIISYSGGITGEIVSGCEDKADTSHYVNKIGNKKTLTELTIEQGKINAEIVDINKQANSTIEKVAQLEITADGINQRVERTEQSIVTNSNNITSANRLISTLQTGLNTTNNNLSATNNTVSNLSSQVTTNKKNIASITTTVDSITQQVGQTEEKIETIEGSITGINVNVSGMVEDITGLNNSLNTANTNISNAIKNLNALRGEVDGVTDDLGEFGDDLGALSGVVDGVIVDIEDIQGSVTSNSEKIASIKTNVDSITQTVSNTEKNVTTLSGKITTANNNISSLQSGLNSTNGNVTGLQTGLNTTNSNLTALDKTVTNINATVESNKNQIASIVTNVDSITQTVSNTEKNVTTLSGTITATNKNVSALQTGLSGANTNISNLQTGLSGANTNINTLQSGLSSANQNVSNLQNKLNTTNSNVSNLQNGLNTTNGNVSALNTTVTNINAQVESNKSQIASIKTDVNGITQKVTNTEKTVTTLSGTVTQTNKDLSSLGNKVNGIEVGGRNLLINSSFVKTNTGGWVNSGVLTDGYLNFKAVNIDNSKATSGTVDKLSQVIHGGSYNRKLQAGQWYTFSFYTKGSGQIRTHIYPSLIDTAIKGYTDGAEVVLSADGYKDWVLTDTWTRHTYTFKTRATIPDTVQSLLFRVAFGCNVYVCMPMLELGNKVSAFTEAPEDTTAEIGKVDVKVENNKTQLATLSTTLNSITQRVESTESTTTTLNTTLTNTNKNLSTLQTNLGTANTNISNLQSGLNTANSNITTNKNNITTANNNITTNKNNIATNKTNITNLTTTVSNTNTKVATIETNLSGITSKVTGLETTTATINKNLNDLNIGARNYIKNGDFSQGSKHWSSLTGVKEFGGYNCAYRTHTATTGESFISSPRVYGLGGKQITLSFLGACEGVDTKSLEIYLLARRTGSTSDYDYTPNKLITINKNLALYSWTYTLPNDVGSFYIRFDNNAQSVATTIYVTNVQIEVGNKVTDFKPSPEDVNIAIDNVYNHVDTQIIEVKNGYSSAIEILQGQINSTVEETTSIRDEISSLEGKWSTNINQTAKDITTTVTETIKGVSDDLQEFENTVQTYMKFNSDGLELGKTGNRFKTKLTNTKLSFLDDSTEVAYISNKKMYITDAEVTNQLTIGKYAFVPRANGNTSLKWIG